MCTCVEHFSQTLVTDLSKVVNKQADDWDLHLEPIAFAYQQSSTKMLPFQLMYGIQARLPSELTYDNTNDAAYDDDATAAAVVERAMKATELMNKLRGTAKENIDKAQAKQKVQYDVKHRAPCSTVSNRVMCCNRRCE